MCKTKACLLTLLLAAVSFGAQAQMADRLNESPTFGKTINASAQLATREMVARLHLNEGQYLKLLPLNRTKFAGLHSINQEYKNDETTRMSKVAELETQYEQECSRILTPSQLSQMQQRKSTPTTAPATAGNGLG